MSQRRFGRLSTSIIAALALAVVAGCGDSSDGDEDAAVNRPTGTPVKIGYLLAQSGPLASTVAAAGPAAQAWESATNNAGGIDGHPVEIVLADSKGDASAATAAAKKLVEEEKVTAIMISDPVTEAPLSEYLSDADIPVIGAGGYAAPVWTKIPNFFTLTNTSYEVTASEVVAAAAAGAKTFGAVACVESATCAENDKVFSDTAKANGVAYSGTSLVSASAANYTAQCVSFKDSKTDAIALVLDGQTGTRVVQNCLQQGYEGMFAIGATSFDPAVYGKIDGLRLVGSLNGFPWWADAPAAAAFRDAMETYQKDVDYAAASATVAWTALELFKKVTTGMADITPVNVIAGYNALKDETLGGLLPQPLTFTEGKPSSPVTCFWQFDYTAGEDNPKLLAPTGESGNGASGDLATACLKST